MAKHNRGNGAGKPEMPKAKLTRENLKEALLIFRYLNPYRRSFIAGLLFIALSSATTMSFPFLLKQLIDNAHDISQGKTAISPGVVAFWKQLIENARNISLSTTAISPGTIALWMLGILCLQMTFSFLRVYLFTYVGEHALADMRRDVYRKMIMMPMNFFAQRRVGELSSRISADLTQIQDAVTGMLAEILRGILTLVI